jgi:hypothetical protein
MLGLYNYIANSKAVQSIVRNGLQLFYKADRTQAPLGEEQIRNNSFDEISSEKVTNGDFATDSDWTEGDGWDIDEANNRITRTAQSGSTSAYQGISFVSGKRYIITYTLDVSAGEIKIRLSGDGTTTETPSRGSSGTYTELITANANHTTFNLRAVAGDFAGSISNVSVKQLDPNNRWTVNNDTPSEQTVEIRYGSFFIEYDSTATKGVANINVTSAGIVNQEYEIKVVVDSIDNDEKLKVQLGNSSHNLSAGTNIFKATSTTTGTLTVGRTDADDSVTATVSSVSLRAITNSIKDHSRNSNDGTLYSGKALHFDGTDDYVILPASNTLVNSDSFTVAFWFKSDESGGSDRRIFTSSVTSGSTYFSVGFNSSDQLIMYLRNSDGNLNTTSADNLVSTTDVTDDVWRRVVVAVEPTSQRFYINNQLIRTFTITKGSQYTDEVAYLGAGPAAGGNDFEGDLSDFQIYEKAWTASDVEFDYNNPDKDVFDNSNSSIVVTDCKSLLRLNEGAGDRVYDAAPVLGAEKVANGDFSDGTTLGWTFENLTADISNNTLKLTSTTATDNRAFYDISTEIGKTYQMSADVKSSALNSISGIGSIGVTTPLRFQDGANADSFTTLKFVFTATLETTKIRLLNSKEGVWGGLGSIAEFDNISVKEIKPAESFAIVGDKNFLHQQPYIPQYAMSSFSKKMVFDGSNDYVACGSDASIDDVFTGGGTFSAWISPTTDGGQDLGTIMGKGTVSIRVKDDDNDGVILNLAKGFSTTNADFLTSDEVVLENKMNHIAITYNDSDPSNTPSFYVNGVLKAIDTGNSTTPAGSASTDAPSNLILGNVSAGGSRSFDGIIDEVSLFDVELTQTEVLELFNSGSSFDSTGHSKYNLNEEVSNGTLDSNSDWTFGDGWSYVDGKASLVQVGNPQLGDYLEQEITGLVDGKTYVISFDLDIISATTTTIGISANGVFGQLSSGDRFFTTSGRKTIAAIYDSSHASGTKYLRFVGGSSTEFTIDNVSVKEQGLSAYWRNNGAAQWDDLSMNSNHGTVSGSPTEIFLQEVPFFGKDSLGMFMNKPRLGGLNFNGSGYVEIADTDDLDFPAATGSGDVGEFSVECWVRYKFLAQGSSPYNVIYSNGGEYDDTDTFSLSTNSSNLISFYVNNTFNFSTSSFSLDEWVHVVGTREHGTNGAKLYINGNTTPEATATNNNTVTNSLNKRIGWDGAANRYLESVVDDVRVYNRALTPAEISKNYNATKGKHKN